MLEKVTHHLDPRLVGHEELFGATPEEHGHAARVRTPRHLRHQRGLADPGLSCDQHRPRLAVGHRRLQRVVDVGELLGAADEPEDRVVRRREEPRGQRHRPGHDLRLPHDLDRVDRVRQSLQLERPHLDEGLGRVPADHRPHDLGREDLAAVGRRAQACRLDDRVAEVVAVVFGHLARAQAHPDRQRLHRAPVVGVDALLDADRAGDRPARARERHHEAVAQVLDLDAAGRLDRTAEKREVGLPQLLGRLRAQ